MDYKNMSSKDLIHLISNQALGQNITENNKLVIQDCCKELFEKKNMITPYKRITYIKNKADIDEDGQLFCRSKIKKRIIEVVGNEGYDENHIIEFPKMIHYKTLERMDTEKCIIFQNCEMNDVSYTILEVEDIN